MIEKFIPYILGVRAYDLQAHIWRDELSGAGWINLSNEERKEIKNESVKYL